MMFNFAVFLTLATVVAARKCHNLTIPISISAQNAVFDLQAPVSNVDVTNFLLDWVRPGINLTDNLLTGYKTISGNYNIAATYCQPDHGPGKILQILTHGVTVDRSYWDYPFNSYNYSYVSQAVDQHGHSTFAWDRLGVAASSKGEPVNEIQQSLQLAALTELSTRLRNGSLSGINANFSKFVHVGHSYGSVMTYNFINANPDFSDAAILTGFSQNAHFLVDFALGGDFKPVKQIPSIAAKYPAGYLGAASSIGVQTQFFAPGDFDPKMLDYVYAHTQATTPGEVLTVGSGVSAINTYRGNLLIVTGDADVPFCGGNCSDTTTIQGAFPNLVAASQPFFPNASRFETTIVPGGSHVLNWGYSHTPTYASIFKFLSPL